MTHRFVTPDKQLNERAWATVCANAARAAAEGCHGADVSFRSRYSLAIGRLLAHLPVELLLRAVQLASEHGDLATTDEINAEFAERAGPSPKAIKRFNLDELYGLPDAGAQEAEYLRMLEGTALALDGEAVDPAYGAHRTRVMVTGMLMLWRKAGLNAFLGHTPQNLLNKRTAILLVIRSRQRLFFSDYQLELTLSPQAATYASNIPLQGADGAALQAKDLPREHFDWLAHVLLAFQRAVQRMEALHVAPPLANSRAWALIHAATQDSPGTLGR